MTSDIAPTKQEKELMVAILSYAKSIDICGFCVAFSYDERPTMVELIVHHVKHGVVV